MHLDFRDNWLTDLALRMQMSELAFDRDGLCQLLLDEELSVTFYKGENTPALVMFGQLPLALFSADIIKQMLIENRNHANQTVPVLSIDEFSNAIEVHLKLTQEELEAQKDPLAVLINCMEYWRMHGNSS